VGGGDDDQDDAEPESVAVASGVAAIAFGLSPDHGSGTFLVVVDALLPAVPTFAVPLAVCSA
jgi:hypothetical protein